MTDRAPLAGERLDEIAARAAALYEYGKPDDAAWEVLAGDDMPALVADLRLLRAVLDAEKQAHRFTLRQRNNRSTRLMHLRDLALAGDVEALVAAAKDTLAASVDDHARCGEGASEAAGAPLAAEPGPEAYGDAGTAARPSHGHTATPEATDTPQTPVPALEAPEPHATPETPPHARTAAPATAEETSR